MIRARSQLFFYNLVAWWLAFILANGLRIALSPNKFVQERWRTIPYQVDKIRDICLFGMITFMSIGLVLLTLELFIRLGWEPRFLERFQPGCIVLEKDVSSSGQATIIVRKTDGIMESYLADAGESRELEIGSIYHLWVIGQYISRSRLAESNIDLTRVSVWQVVPLAKPTISSSAWFTMVLFFLSSTYLFSVGIFYVCTGSMVLPVLERKARALPPSTMRIEGIGVHALGIVFCALSLAILTWIIYFWKNGWDDSMNDSHLYGD